MRGVAQFVALALAVVGTALMLVAGIGLLRMPDLLTRMHASSKAGTLGAALVLAGVAVRSASTAVVLEVVLIVLFLFLTAPVAAHMIGRAAYRSGVRLSEETVIDELGEREGDAGEAGPRARGTGSSQLPLDNGSGQDG